MPGLLQRGAQFGHAPATACSAFSATAGSFPASNTIWSRQRDDVSLDQMQKFWDELPIEVRHELLRIDKQTFCEQARKNLYCSRCHGLLLECYSQILVYGKSLQHEFYGRCCTRKTTADVFAVDESDNLQDPSLHPWGGLATTKDGILTLLDCFICASSLDVLHKVFDSSRRREHDRELLYPDACGGGGRGWISQGLINYGRGHGTREACALHTSRLSCDTLVDFWSALADETRSSLLHMKEDDFIERLMYRFDSKRFCRDCRRNVLREFKELKELKRLRKELHCSSWFCVADTAIQYEVSEDSVVADWQYSFEETSTYHHFEWAIGTEEGKTDILDFEDAGMNGKVQVNGLDLSNLSACFITLRAWKLDGRCTELCVKAHALKGQACVHQRLIVGDGFVSITKGNSIKSFFEHAEEVEEEEDDDSVDKDGIELDGDGSRPQKHAKSPELAREFLLDAATVIFKEQVEKAFREGTARQNAHSLFVSLAIKLLEERVHVACKEIITLEKQIKLLEEEENEKREEEERREKRRNKEREKKLRRKERLKEKEKDREIKLIEAKPLSIDLTAFANNSSTIINDESATSIHNSSDSTKDNNTLLEPVFANMTDDNSSNGSADTKNLQGDRPCHEGYAGEFRESIGSFIPKQSKSSRRKLAFERETVEDQATRCYDKHKSTFSSERSIQHVSSMKLKASSRSLSGGPRSFKERVVRLNSRNCIDARFSEKFHSSKMYDYQSYPSNQPGGYKVKDRSHISIIRVGREVNSASPADSSGDWPRQRSRYSKHNHGIPDNCFFPKGGRDVIHTRQVWEPLDVRKKSNRNNLGSDATLSFAAKVRPSEEISYDKDEKGCQRKYTSAEDCSSELPRNAGKVDSISFCESHLDSSKDSSKSDSRTSSRCQNEFIPSERPLGCSKDIADGHNPSSIMSTFSISNSCHSVVNSSSSDSCSSCPSEGDSSTNLSSTLNVETSSTSDSECASQQFDGRDFSSCNGDAFPRNQNNSLDSKFAARGDASHNVTTSLFPLGSCTGASFQREESWKVGYNSVGGVSKADASLPQQNMLQVHNNLSMPTFPSEIMGYENQNAFSWSATAINGLLPFSQHSPYMFPPPVGYGQPANRSSEFGMQYNTMQSPMTAAVFNLQQHHLYHANSRDCRFYPTRPKAQVRNDNVHREEQVIEVPEPREKSSENKVPPLNEGTNKSSSKAHEGNQSFSLFHFGGPLVGAAAYDVKLEYTKEHTGPTLKSVESQDSMACSMKNTKVEEYSLFSTGNSSKFLFSTFTL